LKGGNETRNRSKSAGSVSGIVGAAGAVEDGGSGDQGRREAGGDRGGMAGKNQGGVPRLREGLRGVRSSRDAVVEAFEHDGAYDQAVLSGPAQRVPGAWG